VAKNFVPQKQTESQKLLKLATKNIGQLNSIVYNYAASKIGQKVGDGECATLAVEALKSAGAKNFWQLGPTGNDGDYVWGTRVATITPSNKSTANIRAGDIIQFRNVSTYKKTTFPNGSSSWYTSSYNHHTAIVKGVSGSEIYLLHQNVGENGKTPEAKKIVQTGTINLNDITSGTMWVYRPQR
ncbi:MAG: hypothetical protein WBV73_19145, partial [Phormidium sp.]